MQFYKKQDVCLSVETNFAFVPIKGRNIQNSLLLIWVIMNCCNKNQFEVNQLKIKLGLTNESEDKINQ